jgi:hypothetical protein
VALLLNDHVWKAAYHNTFTGKLSDACWLIVAPVVLACVLRLCRVSAGRSKWLALGTVGIFFTALQVWAPLGDTLVGWYGGIHTADLTDLLALPALLLVPLCWRGRPKRVPLALGISLVACVATSPPAEDWDKRYPCDGEQAWDPNVPLFLHFDHDLAVPTRTPAFQSNIRVYTKNGKEVEILVAQVGPGDVAICAKDGLAPSTEYFWTAGPFDTDSMNTMSVDYTKTGTRSFVTDDRSDNAAISTTLACSGVDPDVYSLLTCDDEYSPDTGETTDTGDTGS